MKHGFSVVDQNKIARLRANYLDRNCAHCGQSKRSHPCERSDHGWTQFLLAFEAADEPRISAACREPLTAHASMLPEHRNRRHPYTGTAGRPVWSGYCIDPRCMCDCHSDEPIERNGRRS